MYGPFRHIRHDKIWEEIEGVEDGGGFVLHSPENSNRVPFIYYTGEMQVVPPVDDMESSPPCYKRGYLKL